MFIRATLTDQRKRSFDVAGALGASGLFLVHATGWPRGYSLALGEHFEVQPINSTELPFTAVLRYSTDLTDQENLKDRTVGLRRIEPAV